MLFAYYPFLYTSGNQIQLEEPQNAGVALSQYKICSKQFSTKKGPVKFSKKGKKIVNLNFGNMALGAEAEAILAPLREAVKEQVRILHSNQFCAIADALMCSG